MGAVDNLASVTIFVLCCCPHPSHTCTEAAAPPRYTQFATAQHQANQSLRANAHPHTAPQVEVAKELNDPERVINREIKLKELYLDANGQNFELSKLDALRSPEEWAAMKSFTGK